MNSPLVSVLIPAYNAEQFIRAALISVLNQTYRNIEIIVVDDGSTDNTYSILEECIVKGVKVIRQENLGQCAANNRAFAESKGEYIKFFDADDLLNAEFIERQVERLNGSTTCVASAEWGRFYNDNPDTFKLSPESVWRDMTPIDWLVESLQDGINMMQCALWLIPREVLNKSGLWDERLSLNNDFDFFIRVLLASDGVRFTPGARLYYRSGVEGSLSQSFNRPALEAAVLSNRLGVKKILTAENSPRTRQVCANALQIWAYNCYPVYPDMAISLEKEISQLGGSNIDFPGGAAAGYLARCIGWKLTKRLQAAYYRYRYKKVV